MGVGGLQGLRTVLSAASRSTAAAEYGNDVCAFWSQLEA
jgi:hypothetical protein